MSKHPNIEDYYNGKYLRIGEYYKGVCGDLVQVLELNTERPPYTKALVRVVNDPENHWVCDRGEGTCWESTVFLQSYYVPAPDYYNSSLWKVLNEGR